MARNSNERYKQLLKTSEKISRDFTESTQKMVNKSIKTVPKKTGADAKGSTTSKTANSSKEAANKDLGADVIGSTQNRTAPEIERQNSITNIVTDADAKGNTEIEGAQKNQLADVKETANSTKESNIDQISNLDSSEDDMEVSAMSTKEKIKKAKLSKYFKKIYVGNLPSQVGKEDIRGFLGLDLTPYAKEVTTVDIKDGFAYVRGPVEMMDAVLSLNGIEWQGKKIIIEKIRSTRLDPAKQHIEKYAKGGSLKKTGQQPAQRAQGGQGAVQQQQTIWGDTPLPQREGGEKESGVEWTRDQGPWNKEGENVARRLQRKKDLDRAKEIDSRTIEIVVASEEQHVPVKMLPSPRFIYDTLREGLKLSSAEQSFWQALYMPNPNNPWRWNIQLAAPRLLSRYQGKRVEVTKTDRQTKKTYNYQLRIKGGRQNLLITAFWSPRVPDHELLEPLRQYGDVKQTRRITYDFAPQLDSGKRTVLLSLYEGVEPRDIPTFVTGLDGQRRKLHFRGKEYHCNKCDQWHTHSEGCTDDSPTDGEKTKSSDEQNAEENTQQTEQTSSNTENSTGSTDQVQKDQDLAPPPAENQSENDSGNTAAEDKISPAADEAKSKDKGGERENTAGGGTPPPIPETPPDKLRESDREDSLDEDHEMDVDSKQQSLKRTRSSDTTDESDEWHVQGGRRNRGKKKTQLTNPS